MPPLVSAVIINHNYGRYLRQCIDSVLAQTYPRIETIVVDDGSTDHSLEVLRSYGHRIVVVSQSNKGPAAARNAGIAISTGEWIAFLDADDLWLAEKILQQSKYFHDDSADLIFCGLEHTDESGIVLGYSDPCFAEDPLRQLATFTSPVTGCSAAAVRAGCLRRLRGFDEMLLCGEDLDLWIRIAAEYKVRTIPSPLVKYRRHPGSLSGNVRMFEDMNFRMLNKVFSNPRCARIHHLKRQAFGKFYMILAGSYFHRAHLPGAIRCVSKALLYRPSEAGYLVGFPLRAFRRFTSSIRSMTPL